MLAKLCSPEGAWRLFKFCCVGALNTAIAFCLYLLFSAAMSIYLAKSLSWSLTCVFSYVVNRAWTFRASDKGFLPLLRFGVVNLCSLGLGLVALAFFASLGGGRVWSYLFSLPITLSASFLGYRFWSFKNVDGRF